DGTGFEGAVAVDSLAISDTAEEESLFGIGSLRIEQAAVHAGDETTVNIGGIIIEEPYARVEIEADSTTNLSRTLIAQEAADDGTQAAAADAPAEDAAATDAAALPAVLVDRIQ